ncbi:unnamed protein product [marine sediment metagenome]|uniref:DUF1640 domain-containing protein n=1 Tax=marine sediment metagenome TaxID=412755 RepID=X1PD19_9ZZZZ
MNSAEAINIITQKFGPEASEALIQYLDDYREDKISVLRAENKNYFLELQKEIAEVRVEISETKSELQKEIAEVRTEIAQTKSELQKEFRAQTRWIITSLFAISGLIIAAIKILWQ